jgi:polyisoprenoid-binding protein YceI
MKLKHLLTAIIISLGFATPAQATENYVFDIKGQHAFIQFKIKHLGYSWLIGNFNTFTGSFTYDEANPENNSVTAEIEVGSIDSNHAERDKHLRSADFFDVAKFPKATFTSTSYEDKGDGKGVLTGNFTLRGITKEIAFDVTQVGAGPDPWGGFRRGFYGSATLHLSDYNMKKSLGPAAEDVNLIFSIEGVRK